MMKKSRVFNGLALAIVQSRRISGSIKVRAVSGELKESTIEITTQKNKASFLTIEDIQK